MAGALSHKVSTTNPPPEQRRRHPRFPCGSSTFGLVQEGPDTPLELVGVRNISQSGVGLVAKRGLELRKIVTLSLFNYQRNFATRVLLRVVYANQQPDHTYFLGGAFIHEIGSEEVEWLQ
jgi:hypothetical protein